MSEELTNSILKEAFENDPFLKSNNNLNTARNNEVLRDITDGSVFLDNTFLKENPKSLYFFLFQDAF